jgi:hypothetical protein
MQHDRDYSLKAKAILAVWMAVTLGTVMLGIGSAASPVIGMAIAKGTFALDSSKVAGNGTLFEGSVLETGNATSEVVLRNGVRMLVDGASRTRIYGDRVLLEQGAGQVESTLSYRIEAAGLQVHSPARSVTKVAVGRDNRVLVAALSGPASVRTASGLLVANLEPGHALEFDAQDAGASAPVIMRGELVKRDGRFLLTDKTSGVTVELQGDKLDQYVGKMVEVHGVVDPKTVAVAGASAVVGVSTITVIDNAKRRGGGILTNGKAGMAGSSKVVIAGVVVAGAATGSAIAVTRSDRQGISQ